MPKMTACLLNGRVIEVEAALDLRNATDKRPDFRCIGCGQAVRVHKSSDYAAAHFEHLKRNPDCLHRPSPVVSSPRRMNLHRASFSGAMLERGFWLYAWRISCGEQQFFYVGRTGDSSSQYAASPFSRLGQHLDIRGKAKGNTLLRHVRTQNLDPFKCAFELVAFGPLFPEQATLALHREFRDQIAPLETSLAQMLRSRGLHVVGTHGVSGSPDPALQAEVERVFKAEFNELTTPLGTD